MGLFANLLILVAFVVLAVAVIITGDPGLTQYTILLGIVIFAITARRR